MVKISVIIPTYNNSKSNLDRLVDSFDQQTMKQEDFEVIFIDDGSNDFQSFKRINDITKTRKNYILHRIPPSQGPSKPRNKGTQIAKGEYVFYCDDDDTVFPQAFERLYKFAKQNNLDIVNPKVIKTKGWSWGWEEYKVTKVNAQKFGVQSMIPMTVPKLYRKTFIDENNLQFPEGEKMLFEDVMFACLAFSKSPKIGILADYPIYHWREQNRSDLLDIGLDYKWSQLTNLALFFENNLSSNDRDTMLLHWYRSRVLGAIRNHFHKNKESIQIQEFKNAYKWRNQFVNKNIVESLSSNDKVLDKILEQNRMDLANSLSASRENITARSYLKDIKFKNDEIIISCSATLTYDEGENVKYVRNPNRVQLKLPKDVKKDLPKVLHYFRDNELENNIYSPLIKGRSSRATWDIKTVEFSEFKYNKSLFNFEVSANLRFSVKLESYIHDCEDKYQPWDLATRFSYLDHFSQRAIACTEDFRKAALINGNTYVVYKNRSGLLSIDLNGSIIDFFSVARLNVDKIYSENNFIIIPIEDTHVFGDNKIKILASIYNDSVDNFIETNALIRTNKNRAYLEIENNNDLKGTCIVHLALGKKSHELKIEI